MPLQERPTDRTLRLLSEPVTDLAEADRAYLASVATRIIWALSYEQFHQLFTAIGRTAEVPSRAVLSGTLTAAVVVARYPYYFIAACAEADPEAFFPEKGESTRSAKQVCRGCPVRTECLDYALDSGERFGIWGRMSKRERRVLRRSSAVAA